MHGTTIKITGISKDNASESYALIIILLLYELKKFQEDLMIPAFT
jgi:hypothetical protein